MDRTLVGQLEEVRRSREVNMYDMRSVQLAAYDMELYDLVSFIAISDASEYGDLMREAALVRHRADV